MTLSAFVTTIAAAREAARAPSHFVDGGHRYHEMLRFRPPMPHRVLCPLALVCLHESGVRLESRDFMAAGKILGIDHDDVLTIVDSADFGGSPDSRFPPHYFNADLRRRMLEAAGAAS